MNNILQAPISDKPTEAHERLQQMGIEAYVEFEALPAIDVDSSGEPSKEGVESVDRALTKLFFIGDAYAQTDADPEDHDHEKAAQRCVEAIKHFVDIGAKAGKISRSRAVLSLLTPRKQEESRHEWEVMRHVVFGQNPNYHGRRFGAEYASAVAFGRVGLSSSVKLESAQQAA